MRWPWVSRVLYEEVRNTLISEKVALRADFRVLTDDYRALLDKYHALRVSGAEPAPALSVPETPYTQLGPLTRAAIADMSVGQSGPIRRAMTTKALAIWLQNRGQESQDEVTAIAVRQGET